MNTTPTIIALTGASGFIGRHIIDALTDQGVVLSAETATKPSTQSQRQRTVQIKALARSPGQLKQLAEPLQERFTIIQGDLDDEAALHDLMDGADIVIHNAGVVRGASAEDFLKVNAAGTARMAQAAQKAGVSRFVLISSLAAREPTLSHYAASKNAAEKELQAVEGLQWRIIRPPAVYGPGDKELAPLFYSMKKGLGVYPAAARESRLSIIHVHDLAIFIFLMALNDDKALDQAIYEPDDGRTGGYCWQDIREIAEEAFQRPVRLLPIPMGLLQLSATINASMAKLLSYSPMLTPEKIRELSHQNWVCRKLPESVDWQAQVPLRQGLKILS